MKKNESLGLLAVAAGNIIFGFSFLFSKLALELTIPSVLIAVRFTMAFAVLNLVVLLGKKIKKDGKPLIAFSLKGKPKKYILLLALFQPIIYFIAENYGIVFTSSSFAGIIISLIPIMGIVLDFVIFREKITVVQGTCALLSVAGVLLTTVGASDVRSSVIGVLILFIAVIAGAMFYVFSKKSSADYNPLERTYVMFALGSLFYICLAAVQCAGKYDELILTALKRPVFWVSVAYLAVVSSVVAFLLLNFGSGYVSVSRATILANLTTVISIFAGVIILHESFGLYQIIGIIIILASVFTATLIKPAK